MINKLVSEIKKKNAPIVVGLDPMSLCANIYRKRHLRIRRDT